jgi:uncharacterized protein (DUF342 family)
LPTRFSRASGNPACGETKTEVTLGNDPVVMNQLSTLKSQLDALLQKSHHLASQLAEIQNSKKRGRELFTSLIDKMEQAMEIKTNVDMAIDQVRKSVHALEEDCKPCADPRLMVSGAIYPGTIILINGATRMITSILKRRLINYERGEIRDSNLT